MIPMNIKIYVEDNQQKPFRLWLPIWLILPLFFIFLFLLLPILIVVLLLVIFVKGLSFAVSAAGAILGLFIALKGTSVEVDGKSKVLIQID